MMYGEFMELAGYEVEYKTYAEIIEPMYMALPDSVTKQDFIKMLDKKAFALPTKRALVRDMRKMAESLRETCEHYTDTETAERLDRAAKAYAKRFYGIDWTHDTKSYVFFNRQYSYPEIGRGCTYPCELVIGRGEYEYERVALA